MDKSSLNVREEKRWVLAICAICAILAILIFCNLKNFHKCIEFISIFYKIIDNICEISENRYKFSKSNGGKLTIFCD